MSKFGRFNAGKDIGPPSVGDQDEDWKRSNLIRQLEGAMKRAAEGERDYRTGTWTKGKDNSLADMEHNAMQSFAERAMSQRRFGRLKDAISVLGDKYGATVKERK